MRNYDFDLEAANDFDVAEQSAPQQSPTRTTPQAATPAQADELPKDFGQLLKLLTLCDNYEGPSGSRAQQARRAAFRRRVACEVYFRQQGEAAPVPTPHPLPSWRNNTEMRLAAILGNALNNKH